MSADFSKGNSVENVPPERFQNQSITNGTQGGAVLFAPPSKSCRFSHPPSPCAKSMAQGISLSADSDLEGTCPLRTPRQLRSAGAALFGNLMRCILFSARIRSVFRTTAIFFCAAKKLRHFPNLFGSWRSFFIFPQLSRSGTALRSYFFLRPFFRLVAAATANAASAVGTRTTANASLVFGVLLMFCAR